MLWLARLHDELLFDREGRYVNGYLSAVVHADRADRACRLVARRQPGGSAASVIKLSSGWRRFNWDLHSALGFWLFLFMLMWGISGFYLGVPEPFTDLVDKFSDPNAEFGERPRRRRADVAVAAAFRALAGQRATARASGRSPAWCPR